MLLCVYLTLEALVAVSFVNSHESAKSIQPLLLDDYDIGNSYRLPNNTIPTNYSINLVFGDFERDDVHFTGSVYIIIRVLEKTSTIVLHSSVLVHTTSLTKSRYGGTAVAHTYDVDVEREFLLIRTTEESLQRDALVWLRIEYSGVIGTSEEDDAGVFRGTYTNANDSLR